MIHALTPQEALDITCASLDFMSLGIDFIRCDDSVIFFDSTIDFHSDAICVDIKRLSNERLPEPVLVSTKEFDFTQQALTKAIKYLVLGQLELIAEGCVDVACELNNDGVLRKQEDSEAFKRFKGVGYARPENDSI